MLKKTMGLGLLFGSALAFSCGGSDDGGGAAGGGTGPAIEEIPGLLAGVYCDVLGTCAAPIFDLYIGGGDCKAKVLPALQDGEFAGYKDAVAKGSLKYDASKVQACVDALKALNCSLPTTRSPAVCKEALQGTVAVGSPCNLNAECTGESYCKGDTCPGTCAPLEAEGVACKADDSCRNGLKCASKKCFKPLGAGGVCKNGDECDITMFCMGSDESKAQTGTCTLLTEVFKAKEGETCDLGKGPLCESGLSCIVDSFTAPSTLVTKCVKEYAAGSACKAGAPDGCPTGQYCGGTDFTTGKFDGTCTAAPGDGQPCAAVFGNNCATGAVCDETGGTPTCRTQQRIGGACASNQACFSENCKSGTCAAGSPCVP
ncbi:MAG: hypothetical protein HY898_10285 [Deltaproteobacteria bacterium]|nr:hypothetical protein [Deltaproteobacteria bacterium]